MMITAIVANVLAFCLVCLGIKFHDRAIGTSKRKKTAFYQVPGWPLLGQLPSMIKNRARVLEDVTIKTLKHGPGFSMTLPGTRLVDVSKPEWLEYIQKSKLSSRTANFAFFLEYHPLTHLGKSTILYSQF